MAKPATIRKEVWPNRSAENRLEPECWPVLNPRFQLSPGATVFTIGSCFARDIEMHLHRLGLKVPTVDFFAENSIFPDSPEFGSLNKYTPPSIYQELSWTQKILDRDDSVRMDDIEQFLYPLDEHLVVDLQRPLAHVIGMTPEEALRQRQIHYSLFRHVFTCDAVIITPGLIECWRDTERQLYVEFNTRLYRKKCPFVFEVLDYPKALSFVQQSIDLINRDNRKKILITTSPVPLLRTFTDDDVITANMYSKSVLRAVAGFVAHANEDVDYFPSYESVMLSKRYEVWQDDLIHAEPSFVGRIMSRVIDSYVRAPETAPSNDLALRFVAHVRHRQWAEAAILWPQIEAQSIKQTGMEFHICAAEFHQHEGRPQSAAAHLKQSLENDEKILGYDFYLRCAAVADLIGDQQLSETYRARALEFAGPNPRRWKVWIKFIDRQQRSASPAAGEGRNDSLVWLLAQAEERFVNDPDFLGFLADYYQARSMPQQSVRLYRKRLQLEPDHSVTLASYAISLLDAGETEQAIQLVPRLCAAKLDDWRHASKLIARLMKLKAFDSALPLARKIAQEYPEEPLTQFRLASCIYHHDGAEAARPLAERAASLDPTKQWTINLLQTIRCDLARKTG